MPIPLLLIVGAALLLAAASALLTGKVIAGSKGLKANYYSRDGEPGLYYLFLTVYVLIGVFIFVSVS
ncbi:MAG TPA: hypothetical protein VK991_10675 [Halomonas sp.]|nr:hypothetical protein [Halomonas sp.]